MGSAMEPFLNPVTDRKEQSQSESPSIADLFLAANTELARSDARLYRSVDQHLKRARAILNQEDSPSTERPILDDPLRDLTGPPSFERQTRQSLQNLCKLHAIRGFSRMTKEGMVEALKSKGVSVPPIPLQALTKSELIAAIESKLYSDCHGDG
jgi:hypothetical protein